MQIFAMHWMPWPYLPDNFGEAYDSALLTTPNELLTLNGRAVN